MTKTPGQSGRSGRQGGFDFKKINSKSGRSRDVVVGKKPKIFLAKTPGRIGRSGQEKLLWEKKEEKNGELSLKVPGESSFRSSQLKPHDSIFEMLSWPKRGRLSQMTPSMMNTLCKIWAREVVMGRKFSEKARSCYGKTWQKFLGPKPVGELGEVGDSVKNREVVMGEKI